MPRPCPQAPSVTRAGQVLQGYLLGVAVGWLVSKAERGGICRGREGLPAGRIVVMDISAICQDEH